MPASGARPFTFAASWLAPSRPSRPSHLSRLLEEDRLAIATIDLLQHMPNLVQRAVRTGTVQHGGYDVAIFCRRTPERMQPLGHQALVPAGAHPSHPLSLGSLRVAAHLQDFDRRLGLLHEI